MLAEKIKFALAGSVGLLTRVGAPIGGWIDLAPQEGTGRGAIAAIDLMVSRPGAGAVFGGEIQPGTSGGEPASRC